MTPRQRSLAIFMLLGCAGCSSPSGAPTSDGGADGREPQCAVDSDADPIGFDPTCYPEWVKPSGPCISHTPACHFCSYAQCPVNSALLSPQTFYDCSCAAGSWNCNVISQPGRGCAPTLSCLGPDGGLAASCISATGQSCAMPDGGTSPICIFALESTPCGDDSCATGCTCSDPAVPSCACK
jgi:hypothetical protein